MVISDNLELGDASSQVRTVSWTAAVLLNFAACICEEIKKDSQSGSCSSKAQM